MFIYYVQAPSALKQVNVAMTGFGASVGPLRNIRMTPCCPRK